MVDFSDNLLHSLGLTDDQAAVYLGALELGEANMQDLARKSGVKRTTIYTFIDELKERGFILETEKGKRSVYHAVHPKQLLEIQKTNIAELERVMPELLAIYNESAVAPRVTFYEGIGGIKEVYADILQAGEAITAYEDLEHIKKGVPDGFFDYFPKERAKRDIVLRSISRDSETARAFVKDNTRLLRETKLLTTDKPFRTDINVYGNKVAMFSFMTEPPFCVLIEDENIAETLRMTWQELWDRLGEAIE